MHIICEQAGLFTNGNYSQIGKLFAEVLYLRMGQNIYTSLSSRAEPKLQQLLMSINKIIYPSAFKILLFHQFFCSSLQNRVLYYKLSGSRVKHGTNSHARQMLKRSQAMKKVGKDLLQRVAMAQGILNLSSPWVTVAICQVELFITHYLQ